MLDIKNLERRWLKYKIKTLLPYFVVLLLLFSLIAAASLWFNSDTSADQRIVKNEKAAVSKTTAPPTLPLLEENATVLEPSMEFVQSFQQRSALNETTAASSPLINKPIRQLPTAPQILNVPEYALPPAQTPSASKTIHSDKTFSINRNESKLDIEELQRRFKETSNANLGLFIARYYYDLGNYDESYNYALKTNNINNKMDESWIIFSKSLVKLGKTDQAKKTLKLYLSQSDSEAARGLLDAIERGNFK